MRVEEIKSTEQKHSFLVLPKALVRPLQPDNDSIIILSNILNENDNGRLVNVKWHRLSSNSSIGLSVLDSEVITSCDILSVLCVPLLVTGRLVTVSVSSI